MKVHLVDGTFELFRSYYGAPPAAGPAGEPVGAVRGIVRSLLSLLREPEVTHVAVAFDHVIESFRNELFAGYKTGDGVPADLMAQFHPAEDAARDLGLVVWPMVEFEADDALATGAARLSVLREVEQVVVCSPDKDLAQCVRGSRVVTFDRMRRRLLDDEGVREKFGVAPASIPDWLALVGDDADGIPGVPRWGAKSASALLGRYGSLEAIPDDAGQWDVDVRGATTLAESLQAHRADVLLYRTLATLRTDVPLVCGLEDLRYQGARRADVEALEARLGGEDLAGLVRVI